MRDPEAEDLKVKIESGAYFAEARAWYSDMFHVPITQRCYYIIVILLAFINTYFSVIAFFGIFPISVPVPFVTYSENLWEEVPHIRRLASGEREDKNVAVMKFLLSSYVEIREAYDLPKYELQYRNIRSESTEKVFDEFRRETDINNPYGFYRLYTNRFRRVIEIESLDFKRGTSSSEAHIVFIAHVIPVGGITEVSRSKWRADLTYSYTDFHVDQSLESYSGVARFLGLTRGSLKASGEKRKVIPMGFIVSGYQAKELLE